MNRFALFVIAASMTLLTACSHSYQFTKNPKIDQLQSAKLAGKRIVLDLASTPEVFDGSGSGHSFHITGIRDNVRTILTKMLGPEAIADSLPSDVVIAVELQFEMSGAFLGISAKCRSTCTIRNAEGKTLGTGTVEKESAIPPIANGGRNCELAMLTSFPEALDLALAGL